MSKILFLGIDGVLNDIVSYRQDDTSLPWKIDDSRLFHIKKIVEYTGAELVLMDAWRKHWSVDETKCDDIGKYLNESLKKYGLAIGNKTYFSANDDRYVELSYYIAEHTEVTAFSILDKTTSDLERATHFIGVEQQQGFSQETVTKVIEMLNSNMTITRNPKLLRDYKIVLDDHLLFMREEDWLVEKKYEGRFFYKKVPTMWGHTDIIRLDKIELTEEFKKALLKAELYAAKKFTRNKNSYYSNWFDEGKQLMSYAFICDRCFMYYHYKQEGFKKQGIDWIPFDDLNPYK